MSKRKASVKRGLSCAWYRQAARDVVKRGAPLEIEGLREAAELSGCNLGALGFADWYRIPDDGSAPRRVVDRKHEAVFFRERVEPRVYPGDHKPGDTKRNVAIGNARRGWEAFGNQLFTANSKTRSMTWGTPAGLSCPAINRPYKEVVDSLQREGKEATPKALIPLLQDKVPEKCLSCYAKTRGGPYSQVATSKAQIARFEWFRDTPDAEVVEVMVDAIAHAGQETCKVKEKIPGQQGPGKCTFTPGVMPKYFRVFDSGDFNTPRDVRVWREIVKRLPAVKFWFPTTTWKICPSSISPDEQREFLRELHALHQLPNSVVRPSALRVDQSAPEVSGLGPGSAVFSSIKQDELKRLRRRAERGEELPARDKFKIEVTEVKAVHHKLGEELRVKGAYVKACDSKKCTPHWVCPGDCTVCRKCWNKDGPPVAYVKHGSKPNADELALLLDRIEGTVGPDQPTEKTRELWNQTRRIWRRVLTNNADMGPQTSTAGSQVIERAG